MKIVSRKKEQEVDIEPDLKALDGPINHEDGDEPTQEEFEFYKENWVIQTAIKLGFKVYHFTDSQTWGFGAGGNLFHVITEHGLQSHPDAVVQTLRDTMEVFKQEPA